MLSRPARRLLCLLVVAGILSLGCTDPAAAPEPGTPALTEASYLTDDLWDDGQAEVAFYQVERSQDQYGRENKQRFVAGTYLVKHRFSPAEMTKRTDGSGVSSFKYALFYRPFKQSFTSFDWCSNLYREVAFPPEGSIEVRKRSDDYGNRRASFSPQPNSYPPAQLPLLIRGLDFSETDTLSFSVAVADSGAHVPARAVLRGTETVKTEAGSYEAERIRVTYESAVPSLIGEESALTEAYWRDTGPERRLVQMAAESGRYRMALVEHLRTPYWKENLWPKLARINERP
ncbi:MAG: hypothetical protein BRD36_00790 [Bacteroidetes bacterium QH_7_64_110]|nr:MAG: hypothetical protein BRD36_00790 [Bacteroidetes bacterium QH_7_64_110]